MDVFGQLSRTPSLLLDFDAHFAEIADLLADLHPAHPLLGALRALTQGGPRSSQGAWWTSAPSAPTPWCCAPSPMARRTRWCTCSSGAGGGSRLLPAARAARASG